MAYHHFAYRYDRLMEDMPYPDWLRFAEQAWDKYGKPRTVVDLGCGTGNIAVPLAQQGYDVIGIDLSEDMLAVAHAKNEEARRRQSPGSQGSLRLLQQDMREWELPQPADAVISFCDCFNYLLEESDIVQALKKTYDGLRPGGVFVFDMHTPHTLTQYAEAQPFFLNEDDIAYIWTCELDEARCEIEHALTIFSLAAGNGEAEDGGIKRGQACFERTQEYHVQRAYPIRWVEEQLKAAGFQDVNAYGDFLWKQPTEHTERVFFTAVK